MCCAYGDQCICINSHIHKQAGGCSIMAGRCFTRFSGKLANCKPRTPGANQGNCCGCGRLLRQVDLALGNPIGYRYSHTIQYAQQHPVSTETEVYIFRSTHTQYSFLSLPPKEKKKKNSPPQWFSRMDSSRDQDGACSTSGVSFMCLVTRIQ